MAIKMICGFTYYNGLISSRDGVVTLTNAIETRLVGLGVAESVDGGEEDAGGEAKLNFSPDTGKTLDPELSDKLDTGDETKETKDAPEDEPDLSGMTLTELKELAKSMGVDTTGMRSKAAVIEAIEAADKPPDPQVME